MCLYDCVDYIKTMPDCLN